MSTAERLAKDLEALGLTSLAAAARRGHYDDFRSELPLPIVALVADLEAATRGRPEHAAEIRAMADRAKNGAYDATREEAQAWADSPAGKAVLNSPEGRAFTRRPK